MQVRGSFSFLHVSLLPVTSFLYYARMTVLLLAIIFISDACMHAKRLQSGPTVCDLVDCSPPVGLLSPWDSPGKNTGVGCHALLQGILLTWGSNPRLLHLLHWQVGSLPLALSGKPLISDNLQYLS